MGELSVSSAPVVIRHGFGEWSSENPPEPLPASNLRVCPTTASVPSQLTTVSYLAVPCLHPHLLAPARTSGFSHLSCVNQASSLARHLRCGLALLRYASLPPTPWHRRFQKQNPGLWHLVLSLIISCSAACPLSACDSSLFTLASAHKAWESSASRWPPPGATRASDLLPTGEPMLGRPKR